MVTNPFVNNNKCSRFDHAKTCINTWTFPLKCEGQSRGSGRLFEGGYYFKYLAHGGGGGGAMNPGGSGETNVQEWGLCSNQHSGCQA